MIEIDNLISQEKLGVKLGVRLRVKLGVKLNKNEISIIKFISIDKNKTAKELSKKLGISLTAIGNNIAKLKKKGLLQRIGSDKSGYWEIINDS